MPKDCRGREVTVGSRVRLLKIAGWLLRDIPPDEQMRLQSMVGQVFEVTEIDEYGSAWIEKWFDGPDHSELRNLHSYSLDPDEMELVAE